MMFAGGRVDSLPTMLRSSSRIAAALGALAAVTTVLLASTTSMGVGAIGKPVGPHMRVVRGVVVHRNLRAHSFGLALPNGIVVEVVSSIQPQIGRRIGVRFVPRHRLPLIANGLSIGPRAHTFQLRGVVTFVSPKARRFVLSGPGVSILIKHRPNLGKLPVLFHDVVMTAHVNDDGAIVERRLRDLRKHRGHYALAGQLLGFVPTSPPAQIAVARKRGGKVKGQVLLSGDDGGPNGTNGNTGSSPSTPTNSVILVTTTITITGPLTSPVAPPPTAPAAAVLTPVTPPPIPPLSCVASSNQLSSFCSTSTPPPLTSDCLSAIQTMFLDYNLPAVAAFGPNSTTPPCEVYALGGYPPSNSSGSISVTVPGNIANRNSSSGNGGIPCTNDFGANTLIDVCL